LKCEARIRYRQPLQECIVQKTNRGIHVCFDEPQRAITPGQSMVCYAPSGDSAHESGAYEVLGGGVIV